MGERLFRRACRWGMLLILTLGMAACAEGGGLTSTAGSARYSVDPLFKEFYLTLGAEHVLGPAISALETRDHLQCQYTERALMCLDPAVTDAGRYFLYPLGKELNIQKDLQLSGLSAPAGARVVDGFVIYEKFLPLYDQLFGARYAGGPLTELRINQDLQRAEQFFENVGFYQSLSDPNGPVFLIPYGAYLCGGGCSSRLNEYWSIVKSNTTEQPFAASVARLGGPAVFGSLLLKPQFTEDGYLQQVYANAVFYASPDQPELVRLRPLPGVLGYEVQPLVEPVQHEQLVFYEIQNGLGHNVPRPFDAFIALHGGLELSGAPISEVMLLTGKNLYQQCFENYCLIFDPAAADSLKVRMAPLGKEFIKKYPPPEEIKIRDLFTAERIQLTASVDRPNLAGGQEQVVRIAVQEAASAAPLERVEASLLVYLPEQPAARYFFPPTDAAGMSQVIIPPQPDLPNGARISYQVCLNLPSEHPVCRMDSYMIWEVDQ